MRVHLYQQQVLVEVEPASRGAFDAQVHVRQENVKDNKLPNNALLYRPNRKGAKKANTVFSKKNCEVGPLTEQTNL